MRDIMKKKDAVVYRILAEVGIDFRRKLPTPQQNTMVNHIIDKEKYFLDIVEQLFTNNPK